MGGYLPTNATGGEPVERLDKEILIVISNDSCVYIVVYISKKNNQSQCLCIYHIYIYIISLYTVYIAIYI